MCSSDLSSGCAIALLAARVVNRLAGLVLWEGPFGQFEGGAPAWWGKVDEDMAAGRLEDAVADYMVGMPPEWLEAVKRSPGYPHLVLTWIPDGEALARVEAAGFQETLRGIDVPGSPALVGPAPDTKRTAGAPGGPYMSTTTSSPAGVLRAIVRAATCSVLLTSGAMATSVFRLSSLDSSRY